MSMEKLIEEVRKFPVLYDQSNEKYRNSEYKKRVWDNIAATLDGETEECKRKWASIRDQLRRTLNKRKMKSGKPGVCVRKYKYEDTLTFLIPFLDMDGLVNVSQIKDDDDDYEFGDDFQDSSTLDTHQEENVNNANECEHQDVTTTNKNEPICSIDPLSIKIEMPEEKHKFVTPTPAKRKILRRREVKKTSPVSQLMAYIIAEKDSQKQSAENAKACLQHPIDAFLAGIAPTLKSLDPVLLNEAKGQIFAVVQDAELKQLHMMKYSTFPSSSHSSSNSSSPQLPNYSILPFPLSSPQSPSSATHATAADPTIGSHFMNE